eukprot:TRINITY_DN869_c0_g1_i1.p1 TRINITY_DN869_c0_g1~~TRINITY_DN869_c0_g1_i1.p1  ORF type:complete len:220 (-),score=41.62 TRINITY_DN869_c0_g1_i1:340-939(-)
MASTSLQVAYSLQCLALRGEALAQSAACPPHSQTLTARPSSMFGKQLRHRCDSSIRSPLGTGKRVVTMGGGGGGVEPDIDENPRALKSTLGEDEMDNFPYGKIDGAHSWHEGDDGEWWDGIQSSLKEMGGPTGFQAVIAWAFLPLLFSCVAFGIEPLYLMGASGVFVIVYAIFEILKPVKETNYEPEMYRKYYNSNQQP